MVLWRRRRSAWRPDRPAPRRNGDWSQSSSAAESSRAVHASRSSNDRPPVLAQPAAGVDAETARRLATQDLPGCAASGWLESGRRVSRRAEAGADRRAALLLVGWYLGSADQGGGRRRRAFHGQAGTVPLAPG